MAIVNLRRSFASRMICRRRKEGKEGGVEAVAKHDTHTQTGSRSFDLHQTCIVFPSHSRSALSRNIRSPLFYPPLSQMPFTANDNPVLVAPRPVRLNTLFTRSRMVSAPDYLERVRFDENSEIDDRKISEFSDKDIPSQRSSPRSVLCYLGLSPVPPVYRSNPS